MNVIDVARNISLLGDVYNLFIDGIWTVFFVRFALFWFDIVIVM